MEFLIYSKKRSPFNGLANWWGPNQRGYTTDFSKAGIYGEAEAREIVAQGETSAAVPAFMPYMWATPTGTFVQDKVIPRSIKNQGAFPDCFVDRRALIHGWFELSYAQYLTLPRSVLQSMPEPWQVKFVKLLEELDETIDLRPKEGRYWVQLRDDRGRYVEDPLMDYDRGRRKIPHKSDTGARG